MKSRLTLAVSIAIFIALRLPLFFDPALHLGWNSDSAIFGMIAKAIAAGRDFPLFFWRQSYLGPLTSYIAAPLVWLMHPMRALRLAASLEVLAGIIFYWLALRRVFDERVANVVALWLAIGPSWFLLFSIATIGGEPLFLLSAIVFWVATRFENWFVLGLLAGFGWWIHQGIVFAVGAAILVHVPRDLVRIRWPRSWGLRLIAGVIAIDVVLGALVSLGFDAPAMFLFYPLLEPLALLALFTLRVGGRGRPPVPWKFAAGAILGYMPVIVATLRGAVPKTYGLSVPTMPLRGTIAHLVTFLRTDLWLFLGMAAAVLVIPFFIAAMFRRPRLDMPLFTIILCVVFYLFSERAHPGSVRYIVAALPMVYAFAANEMLRVRGGTIAVIAVAIALLVPRVQQIRDVADGRGEFYAGLPGGFDPRPVLRAIDAQHYSICYADYWIGYKLQWVSDERIRFIPYRSLDRTRAASRALAAAPGPKCYVDKDGRVSEFHPNPMDAVIRERAREHLRRMNAEPIIP